MNKWEILTESEKAKEKVCCFEVWDKKSNSMIECGKPAYGKKGDTLRTCLREEHFKYAKGLMC